MNCRALVLIACGSLIACSTSDHNDPGTAVWGVIPNDHAKHFQLQVRGAERRLVVFGPDGQQDTLGIHPLMGVGQQPPASPLERVVLASTTHLPFIDALYCIDRVVGLAYTDRVRDPGIRERIEDGRIQEVGRADGLDRERLIAVDPQVVFDHPFGQAGKEKEFPATIAVTEYLEDHPLGRAEWIRFFGMLLGKERTADSVYKAIAHRYEVAQNMSGHLAEKPLVLFGSQWEQRWWMPHGGSYMATLINDAGGRYWFSDSVSDGNIAVSLEQVIVAAESCSYFGVILADPGTVDVDDLAGGDPRIAVLDAVRTGGFVGNSERNDLFGKALLEPEVILKDLRCIFHPGSCAGYRPRYFFPVGQMGTPSLR
ncbi:MAG: ABC transporter substrate-binding protein [Flavobacteriales bacterium]|jgi:iron complex transport system substrate-binding protein|nr:ABC transporter substrate-binding protein [Flavobacteriales bacterium]MBK6549191.1 ABC transporter substrate-binding protein [Flavobacteriales bacterium]MBK6884229.1 ABC transporter substrate-binding protein [Flavobacteriales bacterium]MBK7618160.1 ABC transporter substrate-binding protein [Flavobacteriales bacterium]MBK8533060.1 ABC transporter substrate-binding protein [Flavobacteriales bacterium]